MRVSALLSLALGLSLAPASVAAGPAVFGSVVAIGGTASDIALDETRGALYIADFGGHAIDIMSTATNSLTSTIQVQPWPGAIALSPDAQYLVVAHYCNVASSTSQTAPQTAPPCNNAITAIHLADGSQAVYSLASPPLGVAFAGNGQALVVTTSSFLLFNPATGQNRLLGQIADVALTLPVAAAPTFPGQILQASLATSDDGSTIWGIASAGTPSQLIFQYFASSGSVSATTYVTSPLLLPRLSVSSDGSYGMVGYGLISAGGALIGRYPDVVTSANITGSAIDSANNIVYAQLPDTNQSTGPGSGTPGMLIMDADNLTFRDRISIPEDMVGRAVLNSSATILYAVSESGVMVLPVGALNTYRRVNATQEDVMLSTNFFLQPRCFIRKSHHRRPRREQHRLWHITMPSQACCYYHPSLNREQRLPQSRCWSTRQFSRAPAALPLSAS